MPAKGGVGIATFTLSKAMKYMLVGTFKTSNPIKLITNGRTAK
jgi:hypothetical protein